MGVAIATVFGATAFAAGDRLSTVPDTVEFEGRRWRYHSIRRAVVKEYRGKTALCVNGQRSDGAVYLPGIEFRDGVIEVDMATPDRSAPGIGFRGRDKGKWRNRIMFSRRRGRSQDRRGVVEQAVVTRKASTVLLLNIEESRYYGLSEELGGYDWFHVKIVVQGDTIRVYLNGGQKPSVVVGAMFDGDQKGVLGLCGGDFYFANFKYTTVSGVASAVTE